MEAMTLLGSALDAVLAVLLLWVAWLALASPDLFKAIVLFVAFGLLMALAWVRLDAPDVALAEAAIGAGLTGALFLAALPRLPSAGGAEPGQSMARSEPSFWVPVAALLGAGGGLGYAVLSLPEPVQDLSRAVTEHLPASGVSNPVTAVLLNFRGYDTLLEMGVLLLALLAAWSLRYPPLPRKSAPGRVLDMLSRSLPPVLILVAGYLLWIGSHAPGGAFQAGAVLSAAAVLLLLTGRRMPRGVAGAPVKLLATAGAGTFVLMALVTMGLGGRMLEYPPASAGRLILLVETAATVSIGTTLAALFLGGAPGREDRE